MAAAKSKARSMDATNAARLRWIASKAPALISASTVRLFMRALSTRTQKSNRLLKGPVVPPCGPSPRPARALKNWPVSDDMSSTVTNLNK